MKSTGRSFRTLRLAPSHLRPAKACCLPGGSVENFDVPRLSKLKDVCVTGAGWEFFSPLAWMWLNNRAGPTSNKKFRQAVMYAVDPNFAKAGIWNGRDSG